MPNPSPSDLSELIPVESPALSAAVVIDSHMIPFTSWPSAMLTGRSPSIGVLNGIYLRLAADQAALCVI